MKKIRTSCEHCSTQLSVPESAAGKKIRCPKCKNICLVTAPDRTELGHQGSGVDEAKSEWSLADPWGSFTPSIAKAADSNGIENSAEQLPLTESPQTLHKNAKSVPPRREAPALTETQWFFDENGKRRGPVSESELIQFINTGSVTRGTFVWTRGFPDWLKVENTELHPYLDDSVPPPLYGTQINNTIVWTLAFAPLIGQLLEGILAGLLHGDSDLAIQAVADNDYWFVTLSLNIVLSFFDERRLKRAGFDTGKLFGWVWLVPVYLYKRAKATRQNLAYFIVWMVCFVLAII